MSPVADSMTRLDAAEAEAFDGVPRDTLAARMDVPRLSLHASVGSTLDVAHALAAAGAPAGTLVLADEQTAGRGRLGRRWTSAPGAGLWLTLVERPSDPAAVEVLSLRAGLRAAAVLDRWAGAPVRLKWPNDLYVGERKLGGILIEARWRDARLDWVALGLGVNVGDPPVEHAVGLRPPVDRVELLGELVPALRAAAAARGVLTPGELEAFAARDLARGRRCVAPSAGVVRGIAPDGALVVQQDAAESRHRAGSLTFTEEA
jgi:BirA family transcriptional regulator, biotin operon repressor / biotin---[acetyl-CoA-carboxylase] ligase